MRRLVPGLSTSQEEIDARFFAIVSDLSGAPCELIDESGDVAWRARATDWGKLSSSVRSHACTPLRFPGQYFDAGTGLHHNYLRYYDPEIGRYLSMDPSVWRRRPTRSDTWTARPSPAAPPETLASEDTDPGRIVRDDRHFPSGAAVQSREGNDRLHVRGRGVRPVSCR
ncbi:hypothetical protein GCM10020256_55030 [Streptomyces thermocoprophilus]